MNNIHIIKYAKGHYGQTDDKFADLKKVIAKWSAVGEAYITDFDVVSLVYDEWNEFAPAYAKKQLISEIFIRSHHRTYQDLNVRNTNLDVALAVMMSDLRHTEPEKLPSLDDRLDLVIGDQYWDHLACEFVEIE